MITWPQKTLIISKVMKYNGKKKKQPCKHSDLQNCSVLWLQVIVSGTERMDFLEKWFSIFAALWNLPGKYNYLAVES